MTIKAIETSYKGYLFRSRLEARWAVFFDAMGFDWKYEHQGYQDTKYSDGECYLPDFELWRNGKPGLFVEVKGDPMEMVREHDRHNALHDYGGVLPGFANSHQSGIETNGLILLGDIPDGTRQGLYAHKIVRHAEGLHASWGCFTNIPESPFAILSDETPLSVLAGVECDQCIESGRGDGWKVESKLLRTERNFQPVMEAYKLARAARFEHGENGAR